MTIKVECGALGTHGEAKWRSCLATRCRWTEPPILFETWKPKRVGSLEFVVKIKPVRFFDETRRPRLKVA